MRRIVIVMLFFICGRIATAQEFRIMEPFTPTPEFLEAASRIGYSPEHDGVALLDGLASTHRGTALGAECELVAADHILELNVRKARYHLIVDHYPRSRYEIAARLALIFCDPGMLSPTQRLEESEALITDFGGPTIASIIAADQVARQRLAASLHILPPDLRRSLRDVYLSAEGILDGLGSQEDAFAVAVFRGEAFGLEGDPGANYKLVSRQFGERSPEMARLSLSDRSTAVNPTIEPIRPMPTEQVPPEVLFRVRIHAGDVFSGLVRLDQLSFEIDGQDRRDQLAFTREVDQTLTTPVYETFTLSANLSLELGPHTIKLSVATDLYLGSGTPGRTEKIWSFVVRDSSRSLVLPASADSTLRSHDPHQNEGANPRLVLSHVPEWRGRANNPIVAFDLSQVNLTGLTRATLVLDVRECDLPRFWGPDGRYVQVQRILSPWAEGNGKDLLLLPRHSSRGNGQGATWFSPLDQDISNKGPNGSEEWSGARMAVAPPTAAPALVVNRQTGPVEFDVTQDVLAGAGQGWLVRKQDESRFGNIRFASKEGGAGPTLRLEFGSPTAARPSGLAGVLARDWLAWLGPVWHQLTLTGLAAPV